MTVPAGNLSYAEAEQVGAALRKRWPSITRQSRGPKLAEEQWADLVQCCVRLANDAIAARPEKPGADQ